MTGPTNGQIQRDIGGMQAKIENLEKTMEQILKEIKCLRTGFDQLSGGRRVIVGLFTMSAALGGIIGSLGTYFSTK